MIEAAGLSKTYPGPVPVHALRSADLVVDAGEMVAVVGSSGSGKSTLLALLGLLDRPTGGTLRIDGVETTALNAHGREQIRRRDVGFVFQAFHLVPELSCLANVELALRYAGVAPRQRSSRATEALHSVGLSDRVSALAGTLSGGEQQRVALARALVKHPRILFADEPTGNLDTDNEARVLERLREATDQGTAVVVVTHSADVAANADRMVTMTDGATGGARG
ncbi:MAG: ABC transporter ATP-binding protein [Micrococcales bacterium]|nr:ABC transporter ATP-binding protein [Micrococcales bacterium]